LYYIGGIVRDELLNKQSFDIDITYEGDAIEYCKALEDKGICEILQINEPFGTVRISVDGKEIDVASTRNEFYSEKGHLPQVVDIGCELKKDVLRRDFTINALAKSVETGEIIDYTNGLDDIKSKTLRVLHDGSFVDDPTRIIRGLKFRVRFGFKLDSHTRELQEKYLDNINYDMSYKRVKKELMETFNLNSQKAFKLFFEENIYRLISKKEVIPPDYDIETLVSSFPVKHVWLVYLGFMDLDRLPLTRSESQILKDYLTLKEMDIKFDDYDIYKAFCGKKWESVLLYIINVNSDIGKRFLEICDIDISLNGCVLGRLGIKPSYEYAKCFDFVLREKLKNPKLKITDEIELAKQYFGID
jgi:tRNA nucleotidyltransferase/poly(A) polymerase